jgi:hypothetical protein
MSLCALRSFCRAELSGISSAIERFSRYQSDDAQSVGSVHCPAREVLDNLAGVRIFEIDADLHVMASIAIAIKRGWSQ